MVRFKHPCPLNLQQSHDFDLSGAGHTVELRRIHAEGKDNVA